MHSWGCGANCYCGCDEGYYCAQAALCGCGNSRGCLDCRRCPEGTSSVRGWWNHYEESPEEACFATCPDGYNNVPSRQACYLCEDSKGPDHHIGPPGSCDVVELAVEDDEPHVATVADDDDGESCAGHELAPAPRGSAMTLGAQLVWDWASGQFVLMASWLAVEGARLETVIQVDGCLEEFRFTIDNAVADTAFVTTDAGTCIKHVNITLEESREIFSVCPASQFGFGCSDARADDDCQAGGQYVRLRAETTLYYKEEPSAPYGSTVDPNAPAVVKWVVEADEVNVVTKLVVVNTAGSWLHTHGDPYVISQSEMESYVADSVKIVADEVEDLSEDSLMDAFAVAVPLDNNQAVSCTGGSSRLCDAVLESNGADANIIVAYAFTTEDVSIVNPPFAHVDGLHYAVFAVVGQRDCATAVDGIVRFGLMMADGNIHQLSFTLQLAPDCEIAQEPVPEFRVVATDLPEAITFPASGMFDLGIGFEVLDGDNRRYDATVTAVAVTLHTDAAEAGPRTVLMDEGELAFTDPAGPLFEFMSVSGTSVQLQGDYASLNELGSNGAPSGRLSVTVTLLVDFLTQNGGRRRVQSRVLTVVSNPPSVEGEASIHVTRTGAVPAGVTLVLDGAPTAETLVDVNDAIVEVLEVPAHALSSIEYDYDEESDTTVYVVQFSAAADELSRRLLENQDELCAKPGMSCAESQEPVGRSEGLQVPVPPDVKDCGDDAFNLVAVVAVALLIAGIVGCVFYARNHQSQQQQRKVGPGSEFSDVNGMQSGEQPRHTA